MNLGGTSGRGGVLPALIAALCLAATTVPASAAADQAAALYQPNRVDVIELALDGPEKAKLEAAPDAYVKGTFSLAETLGTPATAGPFSAPQAVEVKLKGDASFRNLDGKAAFKLKFPKAGPFLGLRKMTLNNMVEDPSMTHETLAYTAFRAAGVPAPRTSFAYVYVNGVDYGLHLDVETLDKVALEQRFGSFAAPQHLYEGESGADVRPGGAAEFEVDEGDEVNRADLEALIGAVNSGATPWSTAVAPFADLGEMTKMWAIEKYVGELDGYASGESPFQPNNYYLYSDPSGRFQIFPWGADETWQEGNHLPFDEGHGLLFTHCLGDAGCVATYRQSLASACGAIGSTGLDALAVGTAGVLAPWQQLEQGNTRHEHDLGEIQDGVEETRDFIASRPAEVVSFLGAPCPGVSVPPAPAAGAGNIPSQSPADVRADTLEVGRAKASGGILRTELHIPAAGTISQRLKIATAGGEVGVGRAEMDVEGARDLILNCRLSAALRERLQARWLRIEVVTRFVPAIGRPESDSRRVRLQRATR